MTKEKVVADYYIGLSNGEWKTEQCYFDFDSLGPSIETQAHEAMALHIYDKYKLELIGVVFTKYICAGLIR